VRSSWRRCARHRRQYGDFLVAERAGFSVVASEGFWPRITIYQNTEMSKRGTFMEARLCFPWSSTSSNAIRIRSSQASRPTIFGATFGSAQAVRTVQGQLVSCNYSPCSEGCRFWDGTLSWTIAKRPRQSYIVLRPCILASPIRHDRNILGQVVVINRHKFTVTGVARPRGSQGVT